MAGLFDEPYRHIDWPGTERRKNGRTPTFKGGEIHLDGGRIVHRVIVLDESPGGVLIETGQTVNVPAEIMFRFDNGPLIPASPRWRGNGKIGLQFTGAPATHRTTALPVTEVQKILETGALKTAIRELEAANFYGDSRLREAVDDVRLAELRLKAELATRK